MQAVVSTTVGNFSSKRNVAGNDSPWFLGDRKQSDLPWKWRTKARRQLEGTLVLLICSSTIIKWFIWKDDDGSHQFTQRLLYCFRHLWISCQDQWDWPWKSTKYNLSCSHSISLGARHSVSTLYTADNVYRWAQTEEGNFQARASLCWKHLACRQRKIDDRGKLLFTDSTDKKDSCRRAKEKQTKKLIHSVKL